ncbi:PREDICTED: probable G-protein coupled receptor 33 [Condylura cristata]|uniref:probable G-protein coupled receptor 33 n=1 Tax=Condylura cristata TaxID=143302 RepID=UPI0003346EB0|nr:PREDICTED: probable G-protein coupled receptor 33 [Condylura cristata]
MELINSTDNNLHVSTSQRNSTHFPSIPVSNTMAVLFLFMSCIFGTVTNGLYMWVLKFKMKKTVGTLLFFHLILSYFIFTLTSPFMATLFLKNKHWSFGTVMCKVINSTLSVGMFSSVFFLAAISVDRYLLTLHPIWSQLHRTPRWASSIILGVWVSAIALSMPSMVFRETHTDLKGRVTCTNNYAAFSNWEGKKSQTLSKQIHTALFICRFLLGFLLPFFIITFCYKRVANKMKEKSLFKSNKPFKVMVTAIISFFVCWMPYHVYQGLVLTKTQSQFLELLLILTIVTTFFNTVFSPTLYLFTGENFKMMFKKSILALFESTFNVESSTEKIQNLNSES